MDAEFGPARTRPTWTTAIAEVRTDDVVIRGYRLSELVGQATYADMGFLLVRGDLPTPSERAMLDAILVSLADHGISPSTIVARTLASCGTPIQASMAGAALSIADWHGGSGEETARLLSDAVARARQEGMSLATAGTALVEDRLSRGLQIPGYGHPQHSDGDPRARQLLRICEDLGLAGDHLACLQSVGQALADRTGREPLRAPNITGAIAGILMDLRFAPETVRGLVIAARSLGLTAHIVEELQEGSKWRHAPTEQVAYVGPAAPPSDPSSPTS